MHRFTQIVSLLCGGEPPPHDVESVEKLGDEDYFDLRDWICCNSLPWLTSNGVLDAATAAVAASTQNNDDGSPR